MVENHLQEIEIVGVNLRSLKALIKHSHVEEDDWEGIANILDDYSDRLRSATESIREEMYGLRGIV